VSTIGFRTQCGYCELGTGEDFAGFGQGDWFVFIGVAHFCGLPSVLLLLQQIERMRDRPRSGTIAIATRPMACGTDAPMTH